MILDAHRHFWHYNDEEFGWIADDCLRRDFLPDGGRDIRVIAVEARQKLEETEWLLRLADADDSIAGVVGWVDLRSPELPRQLERFAGARKLVGVRHVVQDEPDPEFIVRPDFVRGVRMALAAGLAYDILIFQRQIPAALKFIDELPDDARLVVDHLAKPERGERGRWNGEWGDGIRELAKRGNVFVKASGLVTEVGKVDFTPYLETVLEAFGPKRVMFGSDHPVLTANLTFDEWVASCRKVLPEECFGETAKNFYKSNHQAS